MKRERQSDTRQHTTPEMCSSRARLDEAGPLTTARVLAVAVQLGDVTCLFTVLAAVFSKLTTFGNHTVARRMGALIGLHDFLLSFYLPQRLGHWPKGMKGI